MSRDLRGRAKNQRSACVSVPPFFGASHTPLSTFPLGRMWYRVWWQVGRDLAKALPVLTVFSLPIAGYLAPAIGFIFPKTLLPPQFWSSPQRLHFMLEVSQRAEKNHHRTSM